MMVDVLAYWKRYVVQQQKPPRPCLYCPRKKRCIWPGVYNVHVTLFTIRRGRWMPIMITCSRFKLMRGSNPRNLLHQEIYRPGCGLCQQYHSHSFPEHTELCHPRPHNLLKMAKLKSDRKMYTWVGTTRPYTFPSVHKVIAWDGLILVFNISIILYATYYNVDDGLHTKLSVVVTLRKTREVRAIQLQFCEWPNAFIKSFHPHKTKSELLRRQLGYLTRVHYLLCCIYKYLRWHGMYLHTHFLLSAHSLSQPQSITDDPSWAFSTISLLLTYLYVATLFVFCMAARI